MNDVPDRVPQYRNGVDGEASGASWGGPIEGTEAVTGSIEEPNPPEVAGIELSCPDLRLTLRATGEETGGAYTLIEYATSAACAGPPLHLHRRMDEVCFVLDGDVTYTLDGRVTAVPAGASLFVPRGASHRFTIAHAARLLLLFTPAGFAGYSRELALIMAATGGRPDAAMMRSLGASYDAAAVE